jgi:hypothetical protein
MTDQAGFGRWTGWCLVLAGLLFLAIGVFTGLLDLSDPRTSAIFVWRQSTAVVIGLLLIFGSIGVYAHHPRRGRPWMLALFILACAGSALLVAFEWQELFLARDLATQFPETFKQLEDADGLTPWDQGAIIGAAGFTLGWMALALSTAFASGFARWGGPLLITGIIALPLLSAALPMPIGPIIGSALIAAGLIRLGLDVVRLSGRA